MDGLSDRGSIPLSSTKNGRNSRNAVERVPAVFAFPINKKQVAANSHVDMLHNLQGRVIL